MFNTTWTCLTCNTHNSTSSDELVAVCSGCKERYDWWQIDLDPDMQADWQYGEVPDAEAGL
jgi:hypothetical protein